MTEHLPHRLLKITLWSLAAYFLLISLAHISGTKLPLLFVYFDVPSTVYQDRIISFFALGWAFFVATGAKDPLSNLALVRALIASALGAVAVLAYINFTTDFAAYSPDIAVWKFWAQTAMLAILTLWIMVLYRLVRNQGQR
ncbi:MAG TPA: hypothetical protein ENJ90_08630 [Devosia sp.]|nr:hypothetical protein [Devosia sp.]